jgi:hypothetical protein
MQKKAHLTLKLKTGDQARVAHGDSIKRGDVLVSPKPDEMDEFNLAKLLGVKPKDIGSFLVVKEGAAVNAGGVIAKKGGLMRKQIIKSPVAGIFTVVNSEKGIIGIKQERKSADITAWFSGEVVELTDEKIVFEVIGHTVDATDGKGQPVSGTLLLVSGPMDALSMPTELEEKILAVADAQSDIIAKADALGALAIIAQELHAPISIPYVVVEDIAALERYHGKTVVVYGDEKQVLVIAESGKVRED